MFKKQKFEAQSAADNFAKSNPFADLSLQNKIITGASAILLIIAIILGFTHSGLKAKENTYSMALDLAQNRNASLTAKTATKVISTPNGQLDEVASNNIKQINDIFTTLTTYKSATDYANNYNKAKNTITDQSFFSKDGFLPPLDNNDPNKSTMASENIKSAPDAVQTYEINSTTFIVLVSQFFYHNDAALNYKDKLSSTNTALIINAQGGKITKASKLNAPNLTN